MEDLSDILKRIASRDIQVDKTAIPNEPIDEVELCERCGNRGWFTRDVAVGDPEFGKIITCECQKDKLAQEQSDRLFRYSNLGYLRRFTFESIEATGINTDQESQNLFSKAYQAAKEYAENPQGWLVLTGSHGSGKTHLAAAIGNHQIDDGNVVLFVHVPDLLDHLRASFGPSSEMSYSDLFDQVRNSNLLILDGLGSHSTTPWAEEKLRQIINHRFNAELPTIFTIIDSLDSLDEYIQSRIRTKNLSNILELRAPAPNRAQKLGQIEPSMLKRMTFKTFNIKGNNPSANQRISLEEAYRASQNFAHDPHGWLTLFGQTGAGKTHLAVSVAAEQINKGNEIFFAFVPELLDYLRLTFSPDTPITYDRLFEEVKNTPLLILDDLGQEKSSSWANEKLYQIIVHRHNARLPTVVTSMVDFTREPTPIGSRVQDPWVGQLIRLDTPDYRNKVRKTSRPVRNKTVS